ncbi:MAG: hypothetical protein Q8M08_05470 [Bacteroidales bacterium]|nr:hypothetical protein [Bacteroidales bacterium]
MRVYRVLPVLLKSSVLGAAFILLNLSVWADAGRNSQIDLARRAYERAVQQRSMQKIIVALIYLGDAQKDKNIDSAYLNYTYALKLADRFKLVRFRPQIFFETGMLHTKAGNFKMAVELFDSARLSALRTGNDTIVCNVDNVMGTIYMDLWNEVQAKSMFEQAYRLATEKKLPRQAGIALGNMARFINDPDSAVTTMKTAINLINKKREKGKEAALIYINIGNRMSDPDSAISYYQKAISSVDGNPISEIVMQACNNMAYSYLDKDQAANAGRLLQYTAIPIAESDSNYDWLASLYDTWSDVKAYRGDFKGALAMQKKAMKARTQAEKRKSAEQVRLLLILLDVKKKDVLFNQAQLRVTSQDRDIRSLKFVILILFTALLLIVATVIGVYQRIKIKTQRKELDLTKRKMDIHDYERKRLAMQLHDLTGPLEKKMVQHFGNLPFHDPSVREELTAVWKKISSTIHDISYQLNHNMVEDLPFPVLITSLVEDYRSVSDLIIEIEIAPGTIVSAEQKVNLFCIIQEMLTNAMKHVQVGSVTISLTEEFENLYLFYQDNGPGFNPGKRKTQSMGINNIFERAFLLGGKATLKTSPGKGTRWIVAIPVTIYEKQK